MIIKRARSRRKEPRSKLIQGRLSESKLAVLDALLKAHGMNRCEFIEACVNAFIVGDLDIEEEK